MLDAATGSTFVAYSLMSLLWNVQVVDGTSVASRLPRSAVAQVAPERSYTRSARTARAFTDVNAQTVIPNGDRLVVGQERPEDMLLKELAGFYDLSGGWDGENAAPPSKAAIREAISFLTLAGSRALGLEPTLHVDGSVILEIGDGSTGSFRFKGDRRVICSVEGTRPTVVGFDGTYLPDEVSAALSV